MLHLRRYKRQKPLALDDDAEIDSVDDAERDNSDSLSIESSSWSRTAKDIIEVLDSNVRFEERVSVEKRLLKGDASVLVATESYELGVDNPRNNQVIRIGCPRNLGVLLQEFGHAGRKDGMVANAFLYFNECVDDKRLGLWIKEALDRAIDGDDK